MTGSTPYSLKKSVNFEKSVQKLVKSYKSKLQKKNFINEISKYLEKLILDPYPSQARSEPLPSTLILPEEWRFYKLVIVIAKGASGQIRIMYLINEQEKIIKLLWIYNHEQFAKRPPDKDIKDTIKELF
jgi:mRNA-degrading endonuclease RelE of RelBE toxin-antitoxin system